MTLAELKKALKEQTIIFGTEKTLKKLKKGEAKKIFISSNCPQHIKKDIEHYAKLTKTELVQLPQSNEELGMICKKPFFISVLCY